MTERAGAIRVGVDVGGTFTDGVLIDSRGKRLKTSKVPTVPGNPADGIVAAITDLIEQAGLSEGDISELVHGTTLVANALIERKGARVGLITTLGHRDTLEIGREHRYDIYDLDIARQLPLVERDLRLGVPERLGPDGRLLVPLDIEALGAAAQELVAKGATSIAVCFLHSFINPVHEVAAQEYLRASFPNLDVSVSHAVAPEIREYERTSTVVANAYVRDRVRAYINDLVRRLGEAGLGCDLSLMLSDGGRGSPALVVERPIALLESGPAGGVVAAATHAAAGGRRDIIAFDMGGTTAKMALVEGQEPSTVREAEVARLKRFKRGSGIPLKLSTVELLEVGAGGGSVAWVNQLGLLKVGPESSGADPGPACYGKGGSAPTVSDADLLLGYLDAGSFLGGKMPLDTAAAERSFEAHLCAPLGLSIEEAAAGVYEVVNEYMARAIRTHIVERGQDPRKFAIVATGGAGPVHAYGVARTLGIEKVLIPPRASTASAFGFLVSSMSINDQRSTIMHLGKTSLKNMSKSFAELESAAAKQIGHLVVGQLSFEWVLDLRFQGQGHEVSIAVPRGDLNQGWLDEVAASFRDRYTLLYGHVPSEELELEVVTLRIRASGPKPSDQGGLDFGYRQGGQARAPRRAYFPELKAYVDCQVVRREALTPGKPIEGPLLVEEDDTTIVVGPSASVIRTQEENLEITLHKSEPRSTNSSDAVASAQYQL